jgi:hypothetical protein
VENLGILTKMAVHATRVRNYHNPAGLLRSPVGRAESRAVSSNIGSVVHTLFSVLLDLFRDVLALI